jgi:hypothetical protein
LKISSERTILFNFLRWLTSVEEMLVVETEEIEVEVAEEEEGGL